MRDLVYYVATTLDGYIARPDGTFNDFPWDDAFIAALMELSPETFPAPMRPEATRAENRRFDAVLMGRNTYQVGLDQGLTNPYPTLDQYVVSASLGESPDPAVTVVPSDVAGFVQELKTKQGKDIWLCGGSKLATSLFEARLIDRVVVKLNPVLFGLGIPMLDHDVPTISLKMDDIRQFDSGHALIEYAVADTPA